jgi:hypothetical protein
MGWREESCWEEEREKFGRREDVPRRQGEIEMEIHGLQFIIFLLKSNYICCT